MLPYVYAVYVGNDLRLIAVAMPKVFVKTKDEVGTILNSSVQIKEDRLD